MSDVKIPVTIHLPAAVWRKLYGFAQEHSTTVGATASALVVKAATPRAATELVKRKPRRYLTQSELDRLVRLYQAGHAISRIAIELDVTDMTVRNKLRRLALYRVAGDGPCAMHDVVRCRMCQPVDQ